ncbi:DUF6693 family protein [Agrobacterium sp.]|uniref:DUF6693 family protein n=1 Tax=Agrobacterium sp. TaxID=361 RepID=UPI0028A7E81B
MYPSINVLSLCSNKTLQQRRYWLSRWWGQLWLSVPITIAAVAMHQPATRAIATHTTTEPQMAAVAVIGARCRGLAGGEALYTHRTDLQPDKEKHVNEMTVSSRLGRLKCSFGTIEAIGTVILWVVLTVVTFGLALLVFPYYLNKAVINKTEVLDVSGRTVGRLNCTFNIGHSIGHVIVWGILILITLGLAGFLYVYRVLRVVLNETRIEYY